MKPADFSPIRADSFSDGYVFCRQGTEQNSVLLPEGVKDPFIPSDFINRDQKNCVTVWNPGQSPEKPQ